MKTLLLNTLVVLALLLTTLSGAFAQMGISNNGSSPDSSAMLDVISSTKGFLVPRMTATERDAITRPANGLLVFCTDNNQYYYNMGTPGTKNWVMLNTQWKSSGLNLYYNSGNVGVGISSPSYLLHIVGGDVKIGNTSGDARKLYFGDGGNVYVGEETTDNRLGLLGNSLMISIGGSMGSNGQVLTSNGTTCSWITPSATGTGITDYVARWTTTGTLGTGLIRDNNTSVGINTAPDGNYRLKIDGGGTMTGVYGGFNADRYGYLGNLNYGVYGQYNTNHYGYLGSNDYGVYGRYDGDHYGYIGGASYGAAGFLLSGYGAGVYGYSNSIPTGTPGVYGCNNSSTSGTTYTISTSTNGVVGYTLNGTAYHFGVFGTRDDDSGGPSAGVIGTVSSSDAGKPWGTLGYQDASDVEYAGYFSGNVKITGGINDGSNYGVLGSVLMSNGSNDVFWSSTAGLSGNGTVNYLPKYTSANTFANSLVYDNGTNVGIGATSLSGKLHVNSSGASTSVYGQYNSNILGYLGSSGYGAYGQNNSTLFGYLGSSSYGAYGQYNSTLFGYLGSSSYGAYGQYSSSIKGYLGSSIYGAYGQNGISLFGYLGGSIYGAYGQYSSDIFGYLGGSSYGIYGNHYTTGGAAGYFFHGGSPSAYTSQWGIDTYMKNSTANDGDSYSHGGNNSGGIRAFSYDGPAYSFAVAGWNYNDDNRCAGVFGASAGGDYWGALGYKSSGNLTYGGYFTSSTTGTGKKASTGSSQGIGIGAWGDLMGADIHGGVYGLFVEGENYGIYSKGTIYSDKPAVQLQDVGKSEKAVLFTNTSTDVTVMTRGQGNLINGRCSILFDQNFNKVISSQTPVIITVTPMGPSNGVYISSSDHEGFSITENNDGNSNVLFSYIAIGTRAGYENPQLPHEVIASDFESNIMQGLHNDAETTTNGKGLYYQNGQLMLGQSPDLTRNAIKKEPRPTK